MYNSRNPEEDGEDDIDDEMRHKVEPSGRQKGFEKKKVDVKSQTRLSSRELEKYNRGFWT